MLQKSFVLHTPQNLELHFKKIQYLTAGEPPVSQLLKKEFEKTKLFYMQRMWKPSKRQMDIVTFIGAKIKLC